MCLQDHAKALLLALALTAAVLSGCAEDASPDDPLQVSDNPVAATPAEAPEAARKPAGRVIDVGGEATDVWADGGTVSVTLASGKVVAVDLSDPRAKPRPTESEPPAVRLGDRELSGKGAAVEVRRGGKAVKTIRGELASADQVVVSGGNAAVLDRKRSALFDLDVDAGKVGLGLRAGQGATNAVADRFGRVLVVDTRTEALLAFSLDPVLLRQRYSVKGAPYGIAYDPERDLAWITLTARNEVVGYDVAGGEPELRHRFPTLRQPDSVTVDEHTGSVVVASAAGEGIQVIEP